MLYFSVIIPNYNHGRFLKQRIESILNQSYKYFEIIILDDASDDNSKEIIENYRENSLISHIVYSSKNTGSPFKQWVKGIKLAKYDWIWIAESDDFASEIFLEKAQLNLISNPSATLFYCNSLILSENKSLTTAEFCRTLMSKNYWDASYLLKGIEEIDRSLKYYSTIPNSSAVVFKKNDLIEHLKTLSNFNYCGDWFAYTVILTKGNVIYTNEVLNQFRRSSFSHSIKETKWKILKLKSDYFRFLQYLLKLNLSNNDKFIIRWFTVKYTGFGSKEIKWQTIARIVFSYFRIDFFLALRVLSDRIALKHKK